MTSHAAGFWDRALATLFDVTLLTLLVALFVVPLAVSITLIIS